MRVLVTNDDGILAEGIQTLVKELSKAADVVVVAPDRERSVIGTAVTLRRQLQVKRALPIAPEVETYSIEGTPADSVILAINKLAKNSIDLVVSGINHGPNLGDDVFISGTVSAALQGYLHGLPAIAISASPRGSSPPEYAAKLAVILAKSIESGVLPGDVLLNVNVPDLPISELKGVKTTQRARQTHRFEVEEERNGEQTFYRLMYHRANNHTEMNTDVQAIEQGYVSITPLHDDLLNYPSASTTAALYDDLFLELKQYQ